MTVLDTPTSEAPDSVPPEEGASASPWPMERDAQTCRCSHLRGSHRGRTHGGACLLCLDAPGFPPCPRFVRVRSEAVEERAHLLADEDPSIPLRLLDARSPRTRLAEATRAAGLIAVGPSDFGTCRKQVEYRERPPEDYEPVEVRKSAAILGSMLDEGMTRARRRRYPWRQYHRPILVPGLDREGEADEFDPIIGRVTDYKSAGEWQWDRVGESGPPERVWKQLQTYGLGLEAAGETVVEVEALYLDRNGGLLERFPRPYDRAYALLAVAELHVIIETLEAGLSLPRDRSGPTLDGICANHCPAVRHCWDLPNVPEDRTPEGWLLARDDEQVADLLAAYLAAHGLVSPNDKRKKEIRVALTGVTEGRYGDATLGWTGGSGGDWVADLDARVEQLAEALTRVAAGETVTLDDLPMPQKFATGRGKSISIKAVRAAVLEAEGRAREAAAPDDLAPGEE